MLPRPRLHSIRGYSIVRPWRIPPRGIQSCALMLSGSRSLRYAHEVPRYRSWRYDVSCCSGIGDAHRALRGVMSGKSGGYALARRHFADEAAVQRWLHVSAHRLAFVVSARGHSDVGLLS